MFPIEEGALAQIAISTVATVLSQGRPPSSTSPAPSRSVLFTNVLASRRALQNLRAGFQTSYEINEPDVGETLGSQGPVMPGDSTQEEGRVGLRDQSAADAPASPFPIADQNNTQTAFRGCQEYLASSLSESFAAIFEATPPRTMSQLCLCIYFC